MKTKKDIVENWLTRYTGQPLAGFGEYVLLTNFDHYLEIFCEVHNTTTQLSWTHQNPCPVPHLMELA